MFCFGSFASEILLGLQGDGKKVICELFFVIGEGEEESERSDSQSLLRY